MGEAALGAAFLGDVEKGHEFGRPLTEGQGAPIEDHIDEAAVGAQLAPHALLDGAHRRLPRAAAHFVPVFARRDVVKAHPEQRLAGMAPQCGRRVVDGEKGVAIGIAQRRRDRVAVEEEAEGGLAGLQIVDVGEPHRHELAGLPIGNVVYSRFGSRPLGLRLLDLRPLDLAPASSRLRRHACTPPTLVSGRCQMRLAVTYQQTLEFYASHP